MKSFIGIFLLLFGLLFGTGRLIMRIYVEYEYVNNIECNWNLADKASTLKQKSEYIDKFVKSLEKANLNGINSALFFQTPDDSFNENFKALKSLQNRLIEISQMNENDFAYQTALQQITEQEQGQARSMLLSIQRCWEKKNYYTIWNPLILTIFLVIQIFAIAIGINIIITDY